MIRLSISSINWLVWVNCMYQAIFDLPRRPSIVFDVIYFYQVAGLFLGTISTKLLCLQGTKDVREEVELEDTELYA